MYEFHAWIGLNDDPYEGDPAVVQGALPALYDLINEAAGLPSARFEILSTNGQLWFVADGLTNRWRVSDGGLLDRILAAIAETLPASWGIVYDRNDDAQAPPGDNAYRVRVMARGQIATREDPFLSPCNPTIED